jgi:hypothetical protein
MSVSYLLIALSRDASAMGSGRLWSLIAVVIGVVGVIVGGVALARASRRVRIGAGSATGRQGAIVAAICGLVGFLIGVVIVATAGGGPGSGFGSVGGVVALVLGLIAMGLGGGALARSRRAR